MLKLISINIERDRHLKERVMLFLKKEKPDVLCVQELLESEVKTIASVAGPHHAFASMTELLDGKVIGLGLFSHIPFTTSSTQFYKGSSDVLPVHEYGDYKSVRYPLLTVSLDVSGKKYTFGTVHMPKTPNGETTDYQLRTLDVLLELLDEKEHFILSGDFNAPRGRETFTKLASVYKDNIPEQYVTSLDRKLHKAGHLDRMVDGLFTTPEYEAKNVRLECGVSDHCAVVADIEKKT